MRKLTRGPGLERAGKHWTTREQDKLLWLWGDNPLHVIARELKRTPKAVHDYACTEMGLSAKRTEMVYFTEAVRRAGIDRYKLKRILKEAGVRFWPSHHRVLDGMKPNPRRRVILVRWEAVQEAVEAHLAKYTITAAAEAVGIHPTTMKRIMVWAGHKPPEVRNRPWFVRLEDARKAFEDYVAANPKFAAHMRPYRRSGRTSSSSCSISANL